MRVTRLALVALIWIVTVGTQAVSAQQLERLEVALWPEYDRPAMLVMLRAFLPPATPLPTTVSLPMPAGATVNAVAKRAADGSLLLAQHTVRSAGDIQVYDIVADTPEIRLEYYAPIDTSTEERRYSFVWPGGAAIGQASYELQHPFGATDLLVTPPEQTQRAGFDGLTYRAGSVGAIGAGQDFFIEIAYTKPTPQLTIASIQQNAPQGGTAPPPQQATPPVSSAPIETDPVDSSTWWIVLPIVFLVGLIVVWFTLSSPKRTGER